MIVEKTSFIVAGAGFGDEGKGSVVDFLVRSNESREVVRYNGGPQAAHHVLIREGKWHCFSQVGSGSFVPGTRTYLSEYMLTNPATLQDELNVLKRKGMPDASERISIHPDCIVVTPLHQLLNQMRESVRGENRHGSVGMGVGEAVRDSRLFASQMLRMGDLTSDVVSRKIRFLWSLKIDQAEQLAAENRHEGAMTALEKFLRDMDQNRLIDGYRALGETFRENIVSRGPDFRNGVVFEGAQGVLLDHKGGFFPHVTKTDSTMSNADRLISEAEHDKATVRKLNVVRAYAHRHGAGPFVTEEPGLSRHLKETFNGHNPWQGAFRVGWFDTLATRYALSLNHRQGMLAVTNLDRLSGFPVIRVCVSYTLEVDCREGDYHAVELDRYFEWHRKRDGTIRITDLICDPERNEDERSRFTELLFRCRPLEFREFPGWNTDISLARFPWSLHSNARRYLGFIGSGKGAGMPIGLVSVGPFGDQKFFL
ncbi:MAG: adenylosuccinate synthetase [Candidatus Moranbacteria bacterium]|nr:adenylosuccinate synthetase [Candidatus Moranbacteria bacterium]